MKNKYYLNKGLYDNKNIFENTIEAIKMGLNTHNGLYLTVRETKDHILVIYEDSNLSRLHNMKDKISDTTYEDLSYLSFYHIPTLEEVLSIVNGKVDIILNLKIKPKNKEIIKVLSKYKGNIYLLGKAKIINKIHKKNKDLSIGEILTKGSFNLFMTKTEFKSIDIGFYNKLKVKKLKEDNIPLIGYLINNNDLLNEYKDVFDYLIIDNYKNLKIDKGMK